MTATHFIESYIDTRTGRCLNTYMPREMYLLEQSLRITKQSANLVTVCTWRIKYKPGYPKPEQHETSK